jgi:hypothetical protein
MENLFMNTEFDSNETKSSNKNKEHNDELPIFEN